MYIHVQLENENNKMEKEGTLKRWRNLPNVGAHYLALWGWHFLLLRCLIHHQLWIRPKNVKHFEINKIVLLTYQRSRWQRRQQQPCRCLASPSMPQEIQRKAPQKQISLRSRRGGKTIQLYVAKDKETQTSTRCMYCTTCVAPGGCSGRSFRSVFGLLGSYFSQEGSDFRHRTLYWGWSTRQA